MFAIGFGFGYFFCKPVKIKKLYRSPSYSPVIVERHKKKNGIGEIGINK